MNVSILSASEVLRMCEPVTDLERRLFEITQELQSDLDYEKQRPVESCDYCSSDDCSECESKIDDIESAIDLIESGKVDDALKKLKSIS